MSNPDVEFFPERPVPDQAQCNEYLETGMGNRCGRPAMMTIRVNGDERCVCYHHLSLLYNMSRRKQRASKSSHAT